MAWKESLPGRLSDIWAGFMLPEMLCNYEINSAAVQGRDPALWVTDILKFGCLIMCWKTDRVILLEEVKLPWGTVWFRSQLRRNFEDLFVERGGKVMVLLWSPPQRHLKTGVGSSSFKHCLVGMKTDRRS